MKFIIKAKNIKENVLLYLSQKLILIVVTYMITAFNYLFALDISLSFNDYNLQEQVSSFLFPAIVIKVVSILFILLITSYTSYCYNNILLRVITFTVGISGIIVITTWL